MPHILQANKHQLVVNIALLLYPITILAIPVINGLIFSILALLGLWTILSQRQELQPLTRQEQLIFVSLLFFFIASQISTFRYGISYGMTGKFIHLPLLIPIYFYLKHTGVSLKALWFGLIGGAIVTIFISFHDLIVEHNLRAQGITHPIIFGDLALILGVMSLAGYGWFAHRNNWQKILPIIALSLGLISSFLSMSRGAWVAIPALFIAFVWFSRSRISLKMSSLFASLLILLLTIIYTIPQTGVSNRIHETINNISRYQQSDINSDDRQTSIGSRLEMWQASWQIFLNNPLLGAGWGNYTEQAKKLVARGERHPTVADYPHPHNQYLSHLASGGMLGFISLLLLLITPAWIFYRNIKYSSNPDIQRIAFAGLLLLIAYAFFALSEAILHRSRPVGFLSIYLAIFLASIFQKKTCNSLP
ncbi:MAG: O-antigen ligase family protein [Gammaproteobacteria bacterium]|nr:O-antigen ligase family protein [Gammaproteobacteria bacterium]